jgi:hypothetical protein
LIVSFSRSAQREKAEIYFGAAAHIRSDHHSGRTWGKKGETPIAESTGAGYCMGLISAVTARGHMRFMIKEEGGVNAEVFVEFLKRLMVGAQDLPNRRPRSCAYCEEDQRVCGEPWRCLAAFLSSTLFAGLQSRRIGVEAPHSITNFADFKKKIKTSILSLQRSPAKIRSFFMKSLARFRQALTRVLIIDRSNSAKAPVI